MLDSRMRSLIDHPLARGAEILARFGLSADGLSVAGFACGMACFAALAFESYMTALAFLLLNRLADGLDGPLARLNGGRGTDRGGFIDIVLDFIFYSGFVFFFAAGRPETALSACFLLFSFAGTGFGFLAYAAIAAGKGIGHERQGRKSLYYLSGLTEGTETIIAFILICLFPEAFPAIALIFGSLCWITAAGRVHQGLADFRQ